MRLRNRLIFVSLLEDLEISERELARRARLSHSTVNHLMTGRRETCALETAIAIARSLNCPITMMFTAETRAEQAAIDGLSSEDRS